MISSRINSLINQSQFIQDKYAIIRVTHRHIVEEFTKHLTQDETAEAKYCEFSALEI